MRQRFEGRRQHVRIEVRDRPEQRLREPLASLIIGCVDQLRCMEEEDVGLLQLAVEIGDLGLELLALFGDLGAFWWCAILWRRPELDQTLPRVLQDRFKL